MTIECSRSVHSIVLRMAQVNNKCYKYKKGGLFCQEVCGERFSDPAIDGVDVYKRQLHTQSREYIVDDLLDVMKERGVEV